MKRLKRWTCLLLAALLCGIPARGGQEPDPAGEDYDGFLVIRREDAVSLFSEEDSALEAVTDGVYWTESREEAEELLASGWAEYMEPNYYATLFDTEEELPPDSPQPGEETEPGQDPGEEPDAGPDRGWAWEAVRAESAARLGLDGRGVRIAVIDSGVDPENPDVQEVRLSEGYDYLNDTADMTDTVSHGTKVIQMLAGDDNGLGVTGLSRGAEIVPLRCFSASNNGSVRVLARAIREAVDVFHCNVINMSWGLTHSTEVLQQAVLYAYQSGVLLIAAAGNVSSQYPQGTVLYPAAYDEVVGVGAADSTFALLSLSQQTEVVHLCAPGGGLTLFDLSGRLVPERGTSFAAPCVSAAAALLKQLVPSLNQDDLAGLLRERSFDMEEPGYDIGSGYGFLRLDLLLETPWAKLYSVPDESGGEALSVSGWIPGEGCAAAASYDGAGCLTGTELAETGGGSYGFETAARSESVSVFFLDSALIPLAPARTFSAGAEES